MENYTHALTLGKEIIVVGDLNCDVLKPDSPSAIALLNFCVSVKPNTTDKRAYTSDRKLSISY